MICWVMQRLGLLEPKADTRPTNSEKEVNYGASAAEHRLDHISAEVERRIASADLETEAVRSRIVSYDQMFRSDR